MAKKMKSPHKKIIYDEYSPIKKDEIASDDPRVLRTRRYANRLEVLKSSGRIDRDDMPSYKSAQRHINKTPELRGKANYFAHLDARARRRGERDL